MYILFFIDLFIFRLLRFATKYKNKYLWYSCQWDNSSLEKQDDIGVNNYMSLYGFQQWAQPLSHSQLKKLLNLFNIISKGTKRLYKLLLHFTMQLDAIFLNFRESLSELLFNETTISRGQNVVVVSKQATLWLSTRKGSIMKNLKQLKREN